VFGPPLTLVGAAVGLNVLLGAAAPSAAALMENARLLGRRSALAASLILGATVAL
jgi:hypothetical protein